MNARAELTKLLRGAGYTVSISMASVLKSSGEVRDRAIRQCLDESRFPGHTASQLKTAQAACKVGVNVLIQRIEVLTRARLRARWGAEERKAKEMCQRLFGDGEGFSGCTFGVALAITEAGKKFDFGRGVLR